MLIELTLLGQPVSAAEAIAMITGITGVYLTIRQSIWCFPVGIINVALYAWIFFSPGVRLYADALLQCIYIVLLFYGWKKWKSKKNNTNPQPAWMPHRTVISMFTVFIFSTVLLASVLYFLTDASYPLLDSSLTVASLCAQWMIAKKFIENWIVWIIADAVYIPLYIIKHLPLTAFLYFVFLLLAVKGLYDWKKNLSVG